MNKLNHIELFAGCGGLSLGLKKVGFNLTFANELSPMAAETFSYNLLNEDLEACAEKSIDLKHTFWLSTQYKSIAKRLIVRSLPTPMPTNKPYNMRFQD